MLTAPELRLSLHYILQSRDAVCDELQRRNGLTPDEIRQLAVQLAEYDQMIMTALGVERSFGGGARFLHTSLGHPRDGRAGATAPSL